MKSKIIIFIALLVPEFCLAQVPMDNLIGWYIADSVVESGGVVSVWTDYSGSNYNLEQATVDRRPIVDYGALNGHNVVVFDGSNDKMSVDYGMLYSSPLTLFIVFNSTAVKNYNIFDGLDASNRFTCWYQTSVSSFRFYNGGTVSNFSSDSDIDFSQMSYVGSDSYNQVFINGESMVYQSSANGSIGGLILGNHYSVSQYLQGSVAEILFYNSELDETDRQAVETYLMDKYSASMDLGEDIMIDYGFCDTLLSIDSTFTNILWSTGESNDTIIISNPGEYFVEATDVFSRIHYDTINITYPVPDVYNSIVCLGDSVLYDPSLTGSYDYLWDDANTESTRYFHDEGNYWLRIEDSFGCFDTVFFSIDVDSFPDNISLGNDTSLCSGNYINLISGEDLCTSFSWTPGGNTDPAQLVTTSGWQKIEVENENLCQAADSIYVTIVGDAPVPVFTVDNFCLGDITLFTDFSTPSGDINQWMWVLDINDTVYSQDLNWSFVEPGDHQINFYVETDAGCSKDTTFSITIFERPIVDFSYNPICTGYAVEFIPDIAIPDGTLLDSYQWIIEGVPVSTEEILIYTFPLEDEYNVELEIFLDNGCSSSNIETVEVLNEYPPLTEVSIIFPQMGVNVPDDEVLFIWNEDDYSVGYELVIANDDDFTDIIYNSGFLASTSENVNLSGSGDTVYWKLVTYDPCMLENNSDIYYFSRYNPSAFQDSLMLWYMADSVNLTLGTVSQLYDLSSNEFDLLQTESDKRPVIVDTTLNSPVLRFDGTDDCVNVDFSESFDQPKTIFILWRPNVGKSQNIFDGITADERMTLYYSYTSRNLRLFAGVNYYYDKDSVFDYTLNTFAVNGESSQYYENSALVGEGNFGTMSITGLTLGCHYNNIQFLNGDIAEVIFMDSLITQETQALIENYLYNKYSPPVNLGYDIRVPYGFCDTAITTAYKPWFTSYEWSTGETDSVIHVNRPGIYTVTVTDIFGFESSDDIRVFYPEVNEFTDTLVCLGETLIWDLELAGDYTYEWYGSGETTQSIELGSVGEFAAILTDTLGCQYKTDTIAFSFDEYELNASIGPEDTTLCAGNRLFLVSNADETTDWQWSTTETSSEIVLSTTGEYSVTTTNWRGCEAIDTINVTINGVVPIPAFESLGQCAYNPINFTDLSTSSGGNIDSWEWLINGDSFSNEQNPSLLETNPELQIDEPINCEITLVIETDDGCGDFLTQDITVYPLPSISFTPQLVCQFEDVEFISSSEVNGGSVILNQWVFEEVEQTGSSINYSFVDNGYKIVQLSSTTDQGCIDSAELEVYVKPAELPVFSTENTCIGDEVYFINETEYNPVTPVQSMEWDFGDESSTSSESSPTHIYDNAGFYDAILDIVYSNGCELQSTQQVEVYYKPEIELSGLDACLGTEFGPVANVSTASGSISDYHWQIGNPVIYESVLANPEMTFDQMGSYPFSLTVGSDVSCEETVVDTIYVRENPLAAFSASRTWGAIPLWVDFTNTSEGAETYYWQFDTINYSVEENPYFVFQDSGTYIVELRSINDYGCYDTETMTIKSVVPLMDIILYSLRTEVNDNYLTTSVYIINNGTLPVEELNLDLNLGNGQIYRETIEDFQSGQVMDYTFTFKAYLADGELPEVVCVEAVDPVYGIYSDIDLTNNTVCKTNVQNLMVFQPYPNPVSDQLICEFIAANAEDISITLVNSLGEIAYKNVISSHFGYKKHLIDVSELSQGVYYLQVSDGEEKVSFKVEVNR